jgi:hypothetical protein
LEQPLFLSCSGMPKRTRTTLSENLKASHSGKANPWLAPIDTILTGQG